jgi:hypothetical protein
MQPLSLRACGSASDASRERTGERACVLWTRWYSPPIPLAGTMYYAGGNNLEDHIWNNFIGNVKKDCNK